MDNKSYTVIQSENKTVYLIGTAHVSSVSADEAFSLIKEVRPGTVCIELDNERIESLKNPDSWKNTDIFSVIKEKKTSYFLVNIILSSYQSRLAKQFDINAGQEMTDSIKAAGEVGAQVVGIDRSIKTTFMRIWRNLGFFEKMKLIFSGLMSFLSDEEITEDDLAEIRDQDMLESALSELSLSFPTVKKYLVDERDMYLAESIKECSGDTVVAVVGAAHVPGIIENFEKSENSTDKSELEFIPPPSAAGKIAGWLIPMALLFMMVYTLISDFSSGLEQLKQWSLYTGILAAAGTLLAGGHIASILVSLVLAPLTALHPLLAVGWFSALTEAKIRKPKVSDFESLPSDLSTFRGFMRNKVIKILLVAALANLGATIGVFIGGINIITIFRNLFS